MRRGGAGAGGRRLPKSSLAPSAVDRTPSVDPHLLHPRNLDHAFSRRDSDAASLCSSRPSSIGTAAPLPSLSDRSSQSAALRAVNSYLSSLPSTLFLRPPLPSARDILSAFRLLLDRLHFPLPASSATFDDELLLFLRLLSCPYKLTRSALKAPGTPHSWPPLLSVLYWLTQLARVSDSLNDSAPAASNGLMLYVTQSYSLYLSGDDDAVADLDEEHLSKTREHAEAAVAAVQLLEKEANELEARKNALTAGPSRREALEAERAVLAEDVRKFEAVVESWGGKIAGMEASVGDWEKELEAKEREGRRMAEENEELIKKVEAQAVNVRDAERMRREMQAVERDIAEVENGKAVLEEKAWELEAAVLKKLDELEVLAEQCNQAIRKLKLGTDFQYVLNAKGSSPAEIIGLNYKTVLKPALNALAEENKMLSVSKLDESIDLQKQLQGNAKILEEKRNHLAVLQVKIDEMDARLSSLKNEMENHVSKCTTEARKMKEELERKEHHLSIVEKEAEEFLKNSEQKLQDALQDSNEETQMCANELLALIDAVSDYKEFIESTISGMMKDLYETADAVASLSAKMVSTSQTTAHV